MPEPGEWVVLRRWYDGPVTVEDTLTRRPHRLAQVLAAAPTPRLTAPLRPLRVAPGQSLGPRAMLHPWET